MMFPSTNWDRERISTMDLLATFEQISEGAARPRDTSLSYRASASAAPEERLVNDSQLLIPIRQHCQ